MTNPNQIDSLAFKPDFARTVERKEAWGAGNGPATRWLDVYRRIRAAGKSLPLITEGAEDALAVLEAVGPEGVWIQVLNPFDSEAEANSFIQQLA